MAADITIIDYGINNLKSVRRAFESINKSVEIVNTQEKVLGAKCLVIPGIGAYENGMLGLRKRGLIEPIRQKASQKTPLLGICLGMQLLFTRSEEFGIHEGLNLLEGEVISFNKKPKQKAFRVPHMGWNELIIKKTDMDSGQSLLKGVLAGSNVYFVHSFYPVPKNKNDVLATTKYADQTYASIVQRDSIVGMQFHPEKSGGIGLGLLKNFCDNYNI